MLSVKSEAVYINRLRWNEGSILRKRPQVERSDTVAATQRCDR